LIEPPSGRQAGQVLVVDVPGVTERDGAMALVGAEVFVERASLPKPAPGEYYWSDLEGLEVVTIEGTSLGRVSHLFATGANDVMVVKGERQRPDPVPAGAGGAGVDLEAGRIEVDWDPEF
jgi:16S rRNA processing protein RimM